MAVNPCPVCSGTNFDFVLRSDAAIYQCTSCSHVFSDMTSIVQHETYDEDYYAAAHKNWFENPNISLFSWIRSALPETVMSILDVGCGKGDFLRYIRDHASSAKRLVGVDYTPNAPTPGIEFIQGDAADIPGDETFDVVVNLAVIEHVPDPVGFTELMAKRCKPGGYVVTMTVNNDSLLYRVARLMYYCGMKTPATRLYSSHHLQHFTVKSLQVSLEKAGLTIVTAYNHNSPLAAIDIPEGGPLKRAIFMVGLIGLLVLGTVTGMGYLQTVVAKRE